MAEKHYHEQRDFARTYLVPFFHSYIPRFESMRVLDIGCAEAGFLAVLAEKGIQCAGIELSPHRVERAKKENPHLTIFLGDITDDSFLASINSQFHLIVLRDVIEHVADRTAMFNNISRLLTDKGYLYITFPPKYSPFAGHQQNGSTFFRFIPFVHLLPEAAIKFLGKVCNERVPLVESVIENHRIGISYNAFKRLYKAFSFKPVKTDFFLVRPVFKTRFGLTPRRLPNIPFFREFLSTSCEVLFQKVE